MVAVSMAADKNRYNDIRKSFGDVFKGQRRFHKLTEWSKSFIDWARTLPYAQELIFPDETE